MRLSLWGALAWTLPLMLVAGMAGGYFTWRWAGLPGLQAELTAGAINLVVMLANAAGMVVYARRKSLVQTAWAYMAAGSLRVLVCLILIVIAPRALNLPQAPLAVWVVAFYLLGLAGEGAWMIRSARAAPVWGNGVERVAGR